MARKTEFNVDDVLMQLMLFFWKNDFEATTMREISEFVNLKPQSLYNKFGNKEDIYVATLECYIKFFKQRLQKIEEQNKNQTEIICDLLVMDWENDMFPKGCMAVDAVGLKEYRSPRVAEAVNNIFSEYRKSIGRVIKNSTRDSKRLEDLLLTFHNGLQVEAKSDSKSGLREKASNFVEIMEVGNESL